MTTFPGSTRVQIVTLAGQLPALDSSVEGLQRKFSMVSDDGKTNGYVLFWIEQKHADAFNVSKICGSSVSVREFDITPGPTNLTLQTSGRSLDETDAILVVNCSYEGISDPQVIRTRLETDHATSSGGVFGKLPGIIAKVYIENVSMNRSGGVYLWNSKQARDDYADGRVSSWTPCLCPT